MGRTRRTRNPEKPHLDQFQLNDGFSSQLPPLDLSNRTRKSGDARLKE